MPNRTLGFWKKSDEFLALIASKKGIVVLPTGTGKTTQSGQALHAAGVTREGMVYIVVPKRILAVELAGRVASEMGVSLGGLVGYQIRGESRQGTTTRILFMTQGILRAKILSNSQLKGVAVILMDEFHMRTLDGDFNVALIERAQSEGSEVAFGLLSATIDPVALADHFQCGVVDGSDLSTTFPVEVRYVEPQQGLYAEVAAQALQLMAEVPGNGLIFMPGKAEIEQTIEALRRVVPNTVTLLPLHGEVDANERHAPFVAREGVTITISTDLVETGATLYDIGWVEDSGLAREIHYNPITDLSALLLTEIAQDRIRQRVGRAGRERSGKYVGLFSPENYAQRAERTEPEIKRVPLREVVLTIKALGLSRTGKPLRLIDNPEKGNWKKAKQQLQSLGFVEQSEAALITEEGRKAVALGCDPREAAMLLRAVEMGCLREMAIAIAAMQAKRLLYRPRHDEEKARQADSAHAVFMTSHICDAWTAVQVLRAAEREKGSSGEFCRKHFVSYPALQEIRQNSRQFLASMERLGYKTNMEPSSEQALCRAIAAGFPDRVFTEGYGGRFVDEEGVTAILADESVVIAESGQLIAWDIREVKTRRGGKLRLITNAAAILALSEETK